MDICSWENTMHLGDISARKSKITKLKKKRKISKRHKNVNCRRKENSGRSRWRWSSRMRERERERFYCVKLPLFEEVLIANIHSGAMSEKIFIMHTGEILNIWIIIILQLFYTCMQFCYCECRSDLTHFQMISWMRGLTRHSYVASNNIPYTSIYAWPRK